MSEPVIIYEDNLGQPLTDTIKFGVRAFDIPDGSTAKFFMREANSATLKVDNAADIVDNDTGSVSYTWEAADLDTPGEYFGWWQIDSGTAFVESNEFPIVVSGHYPGVRTRTGAIYEASRAIMPMTWNKLEDSNEYGDAQLQAKIEVAKLSLLGTSVDVVDEAAMDIRLIDYIAKISVVSVIPAGKDYWATMAETKTTTGTDEVVSYPDRIRMLEELHDQLTQEIAADRDEIAEIIDLPTTVRSNAIPSVSAGTDAGYVTPNPNTNFRDYGFPVHTPNTRRARNAVLNPDPYDVEV